MATSADGGTQQTLNALDTILLFVNILCSICIELNTSEHWEDLDSAMGFSQSINYLQLLQQTHKCWVNHESVRVYLSNIFFFDNEGHCLYLQHHYVISHTGLRNMANVYNMSFPEASMVTHLGRSLVESTLTPSCTKPEKKETVLNTIIVLGD